MIVLALGVILFALSHLLPAFPSLKGRVRAKFGERLYGPVFGVASLLALGLVVLGWKLSPFIAVYDTLDAGWYLNFVLSAIGFIFLGIFIFRGRLRQIVRFPLAIGVMFWATGHLLANGDLASFVLFGGLLAYGAVYLVAGLANGVRPSPEVRGGHDMLSILIGIALYGVMTQLHPVIAGVPILVLTR
jgi:uncharacterized membrane protein